MELIHAIGESSAAARGARLPGSWVHIVEIEG
jgi:hypothetical protein